MERVTSPHCISQPGDKGTHPFSIQDLLYEHFPYTPLRIMTSFNNGKDLTRSRPTPVTVLGILHTFNQFYVTTILWGRATFLHFSAEDAEVQ